MSPLDLLLVAMVGFSVLLGFQAGFARVGMGFLAAVLGVLAGFWFYGIPAAWIHKYFISSDTLAGLLGFFLVFAGFLVAGSVVGKLFSKFFKVTGLSWLDRVLGAGFGLVRGALIAVIFTSVLLAFTPRPLPLWIVSSGMLPYMVDASDMCAALAPKALKDAFRESLAEIRKAWDEELKKTRKRREPGPAKELKKVDA